MPVDDLPDDVATLRRMLIAAHEAGAAREAELAAAKAGLINKTLEIEKLKVQLARLRRQQFGRSSEKIDRIIEQLELMLDELETEAAIGPTTDVSSATVDEDESAAPRKKSPGRRPLPEHLPRREIVHTPACFCPACGGAMRKVGEDVSEVLDYTPAASRSSGTSGRRFPAGSASAWCSGRCRPCRSSAAGQALGCSRTSSSASTAITRRCTARPAFMPARGSISTAR
jgi:hypothetical protein